LTGEVAEIESVTRVFKVGATTGLTFGVVQAFGLLNQPTLFPGGKYRYFDDVIEVLGDPGVPFASAGDSGALVLDQYGNAVGLLYATTQGLSGDVRAYLNPMHYVLARFRARIIP
jgi:hypothetical protein